MKYTELPGIKKELSAIYLGTGNYGSDISPSESFKLLDRFAELGGTFIDTAHVYGAWDTSGYNGGYGNSEKVIGEWLDKPSREEPRPCGHRDATCARKLPARDPRHRRNCEPVAGQT